MDNSPVQSQAPAPAKPVSHKASITGFVLSIASLVLSGVGTLLIHMKSTPATSSDPIANNVGNAISDGTTTVLGAVLGVPFIIGGIVFGALGVLFVLLRLRKVRVMGLVLSVIAIALAVWSISIALAAFEAIKATPAS